MSGLVLGVLLLGSIFPASAGLVSVADFNWDVTPDTAPTDRTLRPHVLSTIDPVPGATWYLFERTDSQGVPIDHPSDGFPKWHEQREVVINYFPWWPFAPDVRYIRISAWTERHEDGGIRLTEFDTAARRTIWYDSRYDRMNFRVDVACGAELGPDVPAWECEAIAIPQADDPTPGCDTGNGDRCWDSALLETIAAQTEFHTWRFAQLAYDDKGTPADCTDDEFGFGNKQNVKSVYPQSVGPRFRFSVPFDGVTFIGLYGAWNGSYGYTQRPTLQTGHRTSSAPMVGSVWTPVAVVTGDAGPLAGAIDCMQQMTPRVPGQQLVKTLPSIPGGVRMTPLKHEVTIFNGGKLFLPMDGGNPDRMEIELPETIHLIDNDASLSPSNDKQYTVAEIVDPPGGTHEPAYRRYRLDKLGGNWLYLNTHLPMYFVFEPGQTEQIVMNGPYTMYLRPILTATPCPASDPDDCWRTLELTPVDPPVVPLPLRLHTNNTWASTRSWVTLPESHPLYDPQVDYFVISKILGFNAVPLIGVNAYDPGAPGFTHPTDGWPRILYTPAERSGPEWAGMTYAIQHSPLSRGFYDAGPPNPPSNPPWWIPGLSELLKWKWKDNGTCSSYQGATLFDRMQACVADKIADHLDPQDQTQQEIDEWARALVFHEQTGYYDMGYDGAVLYRDLALLHETMVYTRPDYVHLDAEFFPWYRSQWLPNLALSENAQLRRLNGESGGQLARRMVTEFWESMMGTITSASPNTKVSLYDATATNDWGYQAFPWSLLEAHDVIPTSSVYGLGNTPEFLVERIRSERESLPAGYELQPWMSSGTPNERTSEEGFATVVQMLGNGATGFNFFAESWDIDDMDDWLKISEAIRMFSWPAADRVTALNDGDYPLGINGEDVVMDGTLEYENVDAIATDATSGRPVAVVSAMELDELHLIAVTPDPLSTTSTPAVAFDLALTGPPATAYVIEDLRDNDPAWNVSVANGVAAFSHPGLARSTVLRFHRFNSAPVAQTLTLLPSAASTGDDLTGGYVYVDAEGDPEDLGARRVRWYRDGQRVPSLDDQLFVPFSETSLGEAWRFEIEVSDGRAISDTFVSPDATIVCAAPLDRTTIDSAGYSPEGQVTLHVSDTSGFPGLYDLYRSLAPSGGFTKVLSGVGDMDPVTTGLQIIDTAAAEHESYYYRVTPHFAGCP